MIYQKEIILNSNYCNDTILAKDDYFKPFIIDALNDLLKTSYEYQNVKEQDDADYRELKNLKKRLATALEKADHKLMKSYYLLKSDHKERTGFYFKKSPSSINQNINKTLIVLEALLNKIKNETNHELDEFNPIFTEILAELTTINKEIHNKKTDMKFNDNQQAKLFKIWKDKYARLKDYVKGFLRGDTLKYNIFFLDMVKKKSPSKPKEVITEKPEVTTQQEPVVPADK